MQKIKNILFDFDGVLAESIQVKTNAFRKIYEKHGTNVVRKVLSHHKENGGMSRFEKFPFYHKNFLNINLNTDQINLLCEQFSEIVLEDVIASAEVEGATWFLEKYFKSMKFWVVSATPSNEIQLIVRRRKLEKYFRGIYGSPTKKIDNVKSIILENNLEVNDTIFLGDARNDFEAARKNSIEFILRQTSENADFSKKFNEFERFTKYFELEQIIKNRI